MSRSKKQVTKASYGIAKSFAGQMLHKNENNIDITEDDAAMRALEEEVMWERSETNKSDVVERNLTQMIDVLHMRLQSLETVVHAREELCEDDIDPNSSKMSKQAPKITDEFEDINPRVAKDQRGHLHKDSNLVSVDGVYIDPLRLVLKSKQMTDNAKKLEMRLEESFGMVNLRELKGKKNKNAASSKTRKSELKKFEQKKAKRTTLEKDLQTNMESFVTRSVMDPEINFVAPLEIPTSFDSSLQSTLNSPLRTSDAGREDRLLGLASIRAGPIDIKWPIPIKWSKHDPRSHLFGNSDGEFDPDLLLHYSMERIHLPVYENTFRWLCKQTVIQEIIIFLFWFCKVKFFQKDARELEESFLVNGISEAYVRILELLGNKARAEYEKDYVYTYLPYVLANAVYYGFYFICPGSRHLYTKGFRKTILLQVVQVLYGIQLCPAAVKATWAKLFPDEVQDDDSEAAETFPVLIATQKSGLHSGSHSSSPEFGATDSPVDLNNGVGTTKGGLLAGDDASGGDSPVSKKNMPSKANSSDNLHKNSSSKMCKSSVNLRPPLVKSGSASNAKSSRKNQFNSLSSDKQTAGINPVTGEITLTYRAGSLSKFNPVNLVPLPKKNRSDNDDNLQSLHNEEIVTEVGDINEDLFGYMTGENNSVKNDSSDVLIEASYMRTNSLPGVGVLDRTTLSQPLSKPKYAKSVRRQNFEKLEARSFSPLVQQYLKKADPVAGQAPQLISRSVPISWAIGGGADTHRKVSIPRELHDELSEKIAATKKHNKRSSLLSHSQQMKSTNHIAKECDIVLGSGSTNISRFSLDLMKKQRNFNRANTAEPQQPPTTAVEDDVANQLAFYESAGIMLENDDDLDAFLS